MRGTHSVEIKIIIAIAAIMLTLFSAVVVNSVFRKDVENMKFVYNSSCVEMSDGVNNSDILR